MTKEPRDVSRGSFVLVKVLLGVKSKVRLLSPCIIGDSDVQTGQKAWLCYARFDDKVKSERQFLAREITFEKDE